MFLYIYRASISRLAESSFAKSRLTDSHNANPYLSFASQYSAINEFGQWPNTPPKTCQGKPFLFKYYMKLTFQRIFTCRVQIKFSKFWHLFFSILEECLARERCNYYVDDRISIKLPGLPYVNKTK